MRLTTSKLHSTVVIGLARKSWEKWQEAAGFSHGLLQFQDMIIRFLGSAGNGLRRNCRSSQSAIWQKHRHIGPYACVRSPRGALEIDMSTRTETRSQSAQTQRNLPGFSIYTIYAPFRKNVNAPIRDLAKHSVSHLRDLAKRIRNCLEDVTKFGRAKSTLRCRR
jgi:hypothetical protein